MRAIFTLLTASAILLFPAPPAFAEDEPLICVETGEVYIEGVIRYDPPDPCFL